MSVFGRRSRLYDVNGNASKLTSPILSPLLSPSPTNVFDFSNTSDYGSSSSISGHDWQDSDHMDNYNNNNTNTYNNNHNSYTNHNGGNNHHHYDPNGHTSELEESRQEVEYTRAPDTFPCGHVLCHNCVRKFMRLRQRSGYSRCPVCHTRLDEDVPLQMMGLAVNGPKSPTPILTSSSPSSPPPSSSHYSSSSSPSSSSSSPSDATPPISLLTNFDEMVHKFSGVHGTELRRLKDESVRSKSMGMTFTNTQCHLCMENHGTLRVVQEYNQLSVKHQRPSVWSNYFYR